MTERANDPIHAAEECARAATPDLAGVYIAWRSITEPDKYLVTREEPGTLPEFIGESTNIAGAVQMMALYLAAELTVCPKRSANTDKDAAEVARLAAMPAQGRPS